MFTKKDMYILMVSCFTLGFFVAVSLRWIIVGAP